MLEISSDPVSKMEKAERSQLHFLLKLFHCFAPVLLGFTISKLQPEEKITPRQKIKPYVSGALAQDEKLSWSSESKTFMWKYQGHTHHGRT